MLQQFSTLLIFLTTSAKAPKACKPSGLTHMYEHDQSSASVEMMLSFSQQLFAAVAQVKTTSSS